MPAKKKTRKPNYPGLITPKSTFGRRHMWLVVVIVFLFGGSVGIILQRRSMAGCGPSTGLASQSEAEDSCDNPPLNNPVLACQAGEPKFDIPLLFDVSGSMKGWASEKATDAAASFVEALKGLDMTYAAATMHYTKAAEFTSSTDETLDFMQQIDHGKAGGPSSIYDIRPFLAKDPRPDVQNLIVIFTDGNIHVDPSIQAVKANGNRVLAISMRKTGDYTNRHVYMAGPKVDTGSVWTSDIITTNLIYGSFNHMKQDLLTAANQLKTCPPGSGNGGGGGGSGSDGNGSGTGGTGSGSGRSGTGSGQRGSGSGGGGTSATRQGNSPNPLPTPSPQGSKKQDPPKQEPSPFFDGKLYGIGSDPDAQSPADLVRNPSKVLKNVWFYIIGGIMVIGGGVGAGWWFWWRKRKG